MPLYEIKIELDGAGWEDYMALHHKLSDAGYERETGQDLIVPHFSRGVRYVKDSSQEQPVIFSDVFRICATSGYQPYIEITKSSEYRNTDGC